MSKNNVKRITHVLIFCVLFLAAGKLLGYISNDDTQSYTRITYHEMYAQDNIDILFVGSSHCYRSFIPDILDKELGMNTFNAGSSGQNTDGSYLVIKEAAKYNHIKHIYLEVYFSVAISERSPTSAYIIADYLKPSLDKTLFLLQATESAHYANSFILARRNWNKLANPSYALHTVKKKLSGEYRNYSYEAVSDEIERYAGKGYVANYQSVIDCNYYSEKGFAPIDIQGIMPDWKTNLDRIIDFCEKKDIPLTLIAAPMSNFQLAGHGNYDEYISYIHNIAENRHINFYDFNLCKEEYFPNTSELFKDPGHLNNNGAETFSRIFAGLVKGEISSDEMFYSSYDEKLAHLSAAVFGISYCDRINDDGITERKCKIVSNRQTGLEYSISLITSSNSAEDDIIYTSDFTDNPDFVLNPDFTGKCIIRYRKAGDKKNINEVTIDS